MRKILSCLCLVVVAAAWLTACSDDDDNNVSNEFTVNDQKYALSAGYYDSVRMQTVGTDVYHFWNVVMASDGISYDDDEFQGTGDAVRFDLYTKQEGQLPVGTYTMSDVDNGIENASAYVGFNTESGEGTIYADQVDDASVTIQESGDTHTITFTLTLDDGKEIKGAFKGTLTEVSNF